MAVGQFGVQAGSDGVVGGVRLKRSQPAPGIEYDGVQHEPALELGVDDSGISVGSLA